jgi:hypothetical protein
VPAAAQADTSTFSVTGAPQTYTVPADTGYITATAVGARGGNNTVATDSQGATVTANLPVTPGETLYVYVGGHGWGAGNGFSGGVQQGGYNGGGNGSAYQNGGSGGGA